MKCGRGIREIGLGQIGVVEYGIPTFDSSIKVSVVMRVIIYFKKPYSLIKWLPKLFCAPTSTSMKGILWLVPLSRMAFFISSSRMVVLLSILWIISNCKDTNSSGTGKTIFQNVTGRCTVPAILHPQLCNGVDGRELDRIQYFFVFLQPK